MRAFKHTAKAHINAKSGMLASLAGHPSTHSTGAHQHQQETGRPVGAPGHKL